MNNKPLHSGHRQRLREKFINSGLDNFNDHEIIELLLFYTIPRRDTNEKAHEILNHFGSLSAVFDASYEEMKKYGLSDKTSLFFKLLPNLSTAYIYDKNYNKNKHYSETSLKKRFITYQLKKQDNIFLIAFFSATGAELFFGPVKGEPGEELTRNTASLALKYNAVSAIVCTNNSIGVPYPSYHEAKYIAMISRALFSINVHLKNWYILSGTDIVSLASKKEFAAIFHTKTEE